MVVTMFYLIFIKILQVHSSIHFFLVIMYLSLFFRYQNAQFYAIRRQYRVAHAPVFALRV